jgi:hypothetical protein
MKFVIHAATLALVTLTGCAVVPYGPPPAVGVGVGVYAAPPPPVYAYPRAYGYYGDRAYGPPGYYRSYPYRW